MRGGGGCGVFEAVVNFLLATDERQLEGAGRKHLGFVEHDGRRSKSISGWGVYLEGQKGVRKKGVRSFPIRSNLFSLP